MLPHLLSILKYKNIIKINKFNRVYSRNYLPKIMGQTDWIAFTVSDDNMGASYDVAYFEGFEFWA